MDANRQFTGICGRFLVVLVVLIAVCITIAGPGCSDGRSALSTRNIPAAYKYAKLKPTDISETAITGGYLSPYIERSMDKGVLDYLEKFEDHGLIENFRIVGKKLDKKH